MRNLIFVIFLLMLNTVPPAQGQDESTFSVDLENAIVIPFARRGIYGDIRAREKLEPIENRLDWLIYVAHGARSQVLISGPLEEDRIKQHFRFTPKFREFEALSMEITAKRNSDLTDEERLALEQELMDKITSLFPARGIKSMNQAEILVRGPLNYFARKDIRELFGITNQQFESILETGRDELNKYRLLYDAERLNMFKTLFQHVSVRQVNAFEAIVGIRLDDVPTIYRSLDEKSLINVVRLSNDYGSLGSRPKELSTYSEAFIGILLSGFSDAELRTNMRDKFPLLNKNGTPVANLSTIAPYFESGMLAGSAVKILPMIRDAINASNQPLSDEQEKLYQVMMRGDGVVDGLMGQIDGGIRVLKNSRLKRKLKPFAESLTRPQQIRAQDTLLFVYGPLRLMLNPPISERLEIDAEQRLQMIEDSFDAWDNLRLHLDEPQKQAFLAILQRLNDRQQALLRERIGVEFETLAERYSVIGHYGFIEDFTPEYRK